MYGSVWEGLRSPPSTSSINHHQTQIHLTRHVCKIFQSVEQKLQGVWWRPNVVASKNLTALNMFYLCWQKPTPPTLVDNVDGNDDDEKEKEADYIDDDDCDDDDDIDDGEDNLDDN